MNHSLIKKGKWQTLTLFLAKELNGHRSLHGLRMIALQGNTFKMLHLIQGYEKKAY